MGLVETWQHTKANQEQSSQIPEYWAKPVNKLMQELNVSQNGLTTDEASACLDTYGPNKMVSKKQISVGKAFLLQLKNPLIDLLLFAGIFSLFLGDPTDAIIIISILFISSGLDIIQEHRASSAIEKLLSIIQPTVQVQRDGECLEIKSEDVVPGDLVLLSAGKNVPADCILLESKDLFLNQMTLTGEAFPVEKKPGIMPRNIGIAQRSNVLFMGTNVVSGSGRALVVKTGMATEFGHISERLQATPPKTEFEQVTSRYGFFLMRITLVGTVFIFIANAILHGSHIPIFDSFLFALALAIGMTPELLPAIITITLASGAKKMAQKQVIVKRLNSIENFGSLNILCSDKTGTLTEGTMHLESITDYKGNPSENVMKYAYMNAYFQSGFINPIDEALRTLTVDVSAYTKLDEIPYDFIRKRLSVVVRNHKSNLLICKGEVRKIIEICTTVETADGETADIIDIRGGILNQFENWSKEGFRVLGVAYRKMMTIPGNLEIHAETDMTFLGFIIFHDPLREGIQEMVKTLKSLQIQLKIITGDNRIVAHHIAEEVNLKHPNMIFGPDLKKMSDEELAKIAPEMEVFAEIEPSQKERIIIALRSSGNVVGFIGDGINDAAAIHAADVGISVNNAVDVAKESADLILLDKHLDVIIDGIIEGRKTFDNTIKYIFITTAANFGNVFTMAAASIILPVLPMLPEQLLLTSVLTDIPYMAVATDNVDQEQIARPRKWNMKYIRQFMTMFGLIGSIFDFITFGVLFYLIGYNLFLQNPTLFQNEFSTGWFLESTMEEMFVIFIIRTKRTFYKSKPGKGLIIAFVSIGIISMAFPYIPFFNTWFHFIPLPLNLFLIVCGIVICYIFTIEITKRIFYKRNEGVY